MQIINNKSCTTFRGQYCSSFSGYNMETYRTRTDRESYSPSLGPELLLHQAAHWTETIKKRTFLVLSRSFAYTRSVWNCESTTQNTDATQLYEVPGTQSTCRQQGKQENCCALSSWLWYVILWAFIGPINRTFIPCLTFLLALTC